MNSDSRRRVRIRFSLGSLLLAITTFVACLATLKIKFQLLDTPGFADMARKLIEPIPASQTYLLITLQVLTILIAALILFRWRKPGLLWVYLAGHCLWLVIVVLATALPTNVFTLSNWISEPTLFYYFCEPTCGLAFLSVAFFQMLFQKNLACIMTLALMLILSLIAELCSIVEIDAFASALAAALRM